MATTVEGLATARGRQVEDVIDAARRAGITVWTGGTPLDDSEIARIDAVLAQTSPRGGAQTWPVPPGGAQTWASPPVAHPPASPPWLAPPPPPPPPAPAPGLSGGKIVAIVLATVAGSILGFVGISALLGGDNSGSDDQFEAVGDSINLDVDSERTTVPLVPEGNDLTVGECFNDLSAPTEDPNAIVAAAYEEMPCSLPHDAEVYAVPVHTDPPGTPFPGDDAIVAFADQQCLQAFEAFVGESYDFSSLDVLYFFPTELTWQRLDDRVVICAVVSLDGSKLTGSMRGSGV